MLGNEQRELVTQTFNATDVDYGAATTLIEQFEAQVDRTPDAVAVQQGDRVWTYRELDEYANRVAHQLVSLGAGANQVVAVCLPRSMERVAALYGVLKSGAAYLPLEVDLPAERRDQILAEASPVAVPAVVRQPVPR